MSLANHATQQVIDEERPAELQTLITTGPTSRRCGLLMTENTVCKPWAPFNTITLEQVPASII